MGIPTRIVGPYDDYPTHEKTRIQCMVPLETFRRLFGPGGLHRRGSQDKVISRFIYRLDSRLVSIEQTDRFPDIHIDHREAIVNTLLNNLNFDERTQ